jgi:hypothetical protein
VGDGLQGQLADNLLPQNFKHLEVKVVEKFPIWNRKFFITVGHLTPLHVHLDTINTTNKLEGVLYGRLRIRPQGAMQGQLGDGFQPQKPWQPRFAQNRQICKNTAFDMAMA